MVPRCEKVLTPRVFLPLLFVASLAFHLAVWRVTPLYKFDYEVMGDSTANVSAGISLAVGAGFDIGAASTILNEVLTEVRPPPPASTMGRNVGRHDATKAPGYPAFLAALFRTFGYHQNNIRAIQVLLSSCIPLLVYGITVQVAGPAAAVLASLLALLHYLYPFWALALMAESLQAVLMPAMVLAWITALKRRSLWLWALAGLTTGAMVSVKSTPFPFLPVVIALLFQRCRRSLGWAALAALVFVGTIGAALFPWAYSNYRVTERWIVFPAYGGHQLLWACDPPYYRVDHQGYVDPPGPVNRSKEFSQLYDVPDEAVPDATLPSGIGRPIARAYEIDRIRARRAIRFILSHPLQMLGTVPQKLWNVWRLDYPGSHPVRRLNLWVTYGLWVPWFFLATWLTLRRGDGLMRLMLGFMWYYIAIHILFASELRYRVPIMGIFFVIAAYGFTAWWDRFRGQGASGEAR